MAPGKTGANKAPPADRSIAVGDHVFYRDKAGRHYCGEVKGSGKDGFCAKSNGQLHRVPHGQYVGHKSRRKREAVVEHDGEDGRLARLDCGNVIFMPHPPEQDEQMTKSAVLPLIFSKSMETGDEGPALRPSVTIGGCYTGDREYWPSGYLKPIAGDRVFQVLPGFTRPVIVSGRAYTTGAGRLRVKVTGVSGPVESDTAIGQSVPITEQWRCFGDHKAMAEMRGTRDPDRVRRAADAQDAFLGATTQAALRAKASEGHRPLDAAGAVVGDRICGWDGGNRIDYIVAAVDEWSIQLYEVGAPERWVGKGKHRTRLIDYSIPIATPDDRQDAMERFTSPGEFGKALRGLVLFAKADKVANRPGLALQDVQTKDGKQTKRWVRTDKSKPAGKERGGHPPAPEGEHPRGHEDKVGQHVTFALEGAKKPGSGKVVATGKDGLTVESVGGKREKVKWDALAAGHTHTPERYGQSKMTDEHVEKMGEIIGETEEDRGANIDQRGVKDENSAYASATQAMAQYKDLINKTGGIADKLGATVFDDDHHGMMEFLHKHPDKLAIAIAPIKGRDRAAEKAKHEMGWHKLKDMVRGSIVVPSLDHVPDALRAIKASGVTVTRMRNRFHKDAGGYRDVLMNVRLPNGHVAELQVHVKGMLEAKEKFGGHSHYEVTRTYEEAEEAAEKAGREFTPTEQETKDYDHAKAHMAELYGSTWKSARR